MVHQSPWLFTIAVTNLPHHLTAFGPNSPHLPLSTIILQPSYYQEFRNPIPKPSTLNSSSTSRNHFSRKIPSPLQTHTFSLFTIFPLPNPHTLFTTRHIHKSLFFFEIKQQKHQSYHQPPSTMTIYTRASNLRIYQVKRKLTPSTTPDELRELAHLKK